MSIWSRLHRRATPALISLLLLNTSSTAQTSVGAPTAGGQQEISATLDRRLAHFRHGINTSHWFAQVYASEGYSKQHFENHTTAEDMRLIKSAGFDHVRLSVNPSMLLNASNPERLPADSMAQLKRATGIAKDW